MQHVGAARMSIFGRALRGKTCKSIVRRPCVAEWQAASNAFPSRQQFYTSGSSSSQTESSRTLTWRRKAGQLQRSLEAEPDNPRRLSDFMRALNHFDPQQAIRVFEQREPQVAFRNSEAVREYIRALVLANRLDFVDLDLLLGRHWRDVHRNVSSVPLNASEAGSSAASNESPGVVELTLPTAQPLQVQIADSHRRALWRLVRSSVTMLIMVAGVSVFAEGLAGNVQKGFGMGSKKITPVEEVNTSFDDVKGCDEVKEELQEIILYLKDPDRFTRLGAKLPKGVMMAGQPGTGKTLLARAIAGEAGVPFLQASGSEFEEMFVGVGARRIRDLFQEARKHAPCIVFIDEIDAVGSKRQSRDNTAVRMTLNQLLVEMDGFENNSGVVVICATNFPESLDKALTRPGRLDKQIVVPVPDLKGRLEILEMYAAKMVLDKGVDLKTIARRTAGMTGADLSNILNIAAVRSSAEGLSCVPTKYLEEAFDRVVVGLERRNPMSEQEKKLTAYHEGGHTLVSLGSSGADPVHKATIMPRGNALGVTWSIPEGEKYSERLFELQARLDVLMGGKAAEELIFGPRNVTAGCTSDLRQATGLARRMVMNFGMSTSAGSTQSGLLSLDVDEYAALSDEAKHDIDQKTQSLLTDAYARAAEYLKTHEQELHRLAKALLEYETLSAEEIKLAIDGDTETIAKQRAEEAEKTKQDMANLSPKEPSPVRPRREPRRTARGEDGKKEKRPEPKKPETEEDE
eukprot:TRINITY_DN5680_c0_g3_i1.p1 TRINITY_DN5680_c0_g3~~TRINITY_DN5680_c0_g3_i1.p1  ORF type:complete len:744 (+),score=122.25 TRINITY_DN5680_c0_g3_i1:128-2359(+)